MPKKIEFVCFSTIPTTKYVVILIYLCEAMLKHSQIILYIFGEELFPPWGERGRGGLEVGITFNAMLLYSFTTIHVHKASALNNGFLS